MPNAYPKAMYRVCNHLYPFLWHTDQQPPARWHEAGSGPVQYLADSAEGAWAEVLRHFDAAEPEEILDLQRSVWMVELPAGLDLGVPDLPADLLLGGSDSYPACQAEAGRLRSAG